MTMRLLQAGKLTSQLANSQRMMSRYLERTIIPTFHFQTSLPRLPIPKLDKTLDRYLISAQPLVSSEDLAETKKLVEDFRKNEGPKLNAELVANDKKQYSSYISEPWFDMYLKDRRPLPINSNPQMTFLDDPAKTTQATRAASLITSSVRFYKTFRDGQLAPEIFHTGKASQTVAWQRRVAAMPQFAAWGLGLISGAYALDMSQYHRLFSGTRIPLVGKDELVQYKEEESRHVIIQRGSSFYTLQVLQDDGEEVPASQVLKGIEAILAEPVDNSSPAIGALTTMNRDDWAKIRQRMVQNSTNKASLKAIDSAMFAVCLEDVLPTNEDDEGRLYLHGSGRNRWFDKTFQLIVGKKGRTAVNFEHAWGDGIAVLRYFNGVFKDSTEAACPTPASEGPSPTKLPFSLDEDLVKNIRKAETDFDKFANSLELKSLMTDEVDSNLFKKLNVGQDGFLQMSFQLAHYRMYGHSAATYESAATAGFKHGRTETIRSATPLSDQFCKLFCTKDATNEEREQALRKAIKNHAAISKEALLGQGWDRHLFALRHMAEQKNMALDIFQDKTYKTLNEIIISTSTLSSPALDGGGFGPVNQRCYGLGYGAREIGAKFTLMTYKRETQVFLEHLLQSLRDMRSVLEGKSIVVK